MTASSSVRLPVAMSARDAPGSLWRVGPRERETLPGMFRWIGRFLLFRFLPARLVPVFAAWELFALVRGLRRARQARRDRRSSRQSRR